MSFFELKKIYIQKFGQFHHAKGHSTTAAAPAASAAAIVVANRKLEKGMPGERDPYTHRVHEGGMEKHHTVVWVRHASRYVVRMMSV